MGIGVALVSDGKSQIAHFPKKKKGNEDNFEYWIGRKRPLALSLLKPRKIYCTRRPSLPEPVWSSLRKASRACMGMVGHPPARRTHGVLVQWLELCTRTKHRQIARETWRVWKKNFLSVVGSTSLQWCLWKLNLFKKPAAGKVSPKR